MGWWWYGPYYICVLKHFSSIIILCITFLISYNISIMILVLRKDYSEGYYRGVWDYKNGIKIESTGQVADVFPYDRYFAFKITKYL